MMKRSKPGAGSVPNFSPEMRPERTLPPGFGPGVDGVDSPVGNSRPPKAPPGWVWKAGCASDTDEPRGSEAGIAVEHSAASDRLSLCEAKPHLDFPNSGRHI